MTQNVYEGTNFEELGAATTPAEFVAAVTATFQGIAATKPAEWAADIAREIAQHKPDLVGLQEVSIVRTGTTSPATTVQSDLLQLIRDELAKLRQRYVLVAVVTKLNAEAPSTLGFNVRLTGQDAILARDDGDLKLSNVQVKNFNLLRGVLRKRPVNSASFSLANENCIAFEDFFPARCLIFPFAARPMQSLEAACHRR